MFENLPEDIQLKIISYVNYQWPIFLFIDKNLNQLVKKFFLDSKLFEEQFPNELNKLKALKTQPNINFFKEFFKIDTKVSQGLSPEMRAFFYYARKGDIDAFKPSHFHIKDFFIHRDIYGRTLLHWMRRNQRQDLLNYIFMHYLDQIHTLRTLPEAVFNAFRITRISAELDEQFWAVTCFQKDELEEKNLITRGTLFEFAMKSANVEIVKAMYDKKPKLAQKLNNVIEENLLFTAVKSQNTDLIQWIFESNLAEFRSLAFNTAASMGNIKVIKVLLKNLNNFPLGDPLYWAAKNGHLEIVKLLLKAGAGPYKINNQSGKTSLQVAIENKHLKIQYLLQLIVYRDEREKGQDYSRMVSFFKNVPIHWIQKELTFNKSTDVNAANALIKVVLGKEPPSHLTPHQAALQHGTLNHFYQNLISEIPGGDVLETTKNSFSSYFWR